MAIIEKAPAKINLGLDIIGKRPDGYHDLSMIMVSVDLNDYIMVSEIDGSEIVVESDNHKMPLNGKNDVFKAAKLIREACQIDSGVKIELKKSIPICAGLGGVSTRTVFPEIDCKTISRVDIASLREAVLAKDYEKMIAYMGNSLEDITIKRKPFIQKIKDRMMSCGADVALMTGSGPTVYALCRSEKKADRLVNSMRGFCKEVYKVRIL